MKVLFIAAHPDDIEYGCAGTIKLLHEQGNSVYWIMMSNGENDFNKTKETRLTELKKSAQLLEVQTENIYYMNCPDGFIPDNAGTIQKLFSLIVKINPDIVLTHFYDDRHQDHRNTSFCVRSACWSNYNLMYFQSYSTMNFEPSIFLDITSAIEIKINALKCYESQINKYNSRCINFVEKAVSVDKSNGGNIHCMYAEGFKSANCVWKI